MGAFSISIKASIDNILKDVNDKLVIVTEDLFVGIIQDTPVATVPYQGEFHPGLLKNNWFTEVNSTSSETTSVADPSGSGSISNVQSVLQANPFLKGDVKVTMTNNQDYAYRAEMLGWEAPRWSGNVAPYRMVATNLIRVAGTY